MEAYQRGRGKAWVGDGGAGRQRPENPRDTGTDRALKNPASPIGKCGLYPKSAEAPRRLPAGGGMNDGHLERALAGDR